MKLLGKICAATATSALLLTTVPATAPVAHAGINWGAAAGALLGGLLSQGSKDSGGSGNGGGLFGGLSNQKHARQNPTSEEKLFMLAVEKNDFETAQQMLNAGVDINGVYPGSNYYSFNNQGLTAFSIALRENNRDMMQFLLERGANIKGWYTYKGDYASYLERLLSSGQGYADIDLIQYLLDWGTDVNECSVTSEGRKTYPIDHCASNFYEDKSAFTTQYLLDKGAYTENKDSLGMTPFLRATDQYKARIMNVLANGGANINARDNKGRTAAQIAIDHHNMQIYKEAQNIMSRGQQPSKYQEIKDKTQKKT